MLVICCITIIPTLLAINTRNSRGHVLNYTLHNINELYICTWTVSGLEQGGRTEQRGTVVLSREGGLSRETVWSGAGRED